MLHTHLQIVATAALLFLIHAMAVQAEEHSDRMGHSIGALNVAKALLSAMMVLILVAIWWKP